MTNDPSRTNEISASAPQPPATEELPLRIRQAAEYFDVHLDGQEKWYDRKANRHKTWHHSLGLLTVIVAATTSVIQIFSSGRVAIATAILGAIVVIGKGIEQIWLFGNTWVSYRTASESMKRERRLYVNYAHPYDESLGEDAAYRRFVQRVEQIISEEQENYWSIRNEDASGGQNASGNT